MIKLLVKNFIKKQAFLFTIFLVPSLLLAQTNFSASSGSFVRLSGTSTFKSWEMSASTLESSVSFKMDNNNRPIGLNSLSFSVESENLKSSSTGLNNNAYKALKTDQYPEIRFNARSAETIRNNGNKYIIEINGRLTVAGVTKRKTIEVTCEKISNNTFICSGETMLNMTDFNVTPPSFMYGAMKTGEEVTIHYNIIYKS